MEELDFTLEFHAEIPDLTADQERELFIQAEDRLKALAEGHSDLIGGSVVLEQPARAESSYIYRARVIAYCRPDRIVAVEKDNTLQGALRGALHAVERQVRERREKLSERWKQP
jgi:hypothetical protein